MFCFFNWKFNPFYQKIHSSFKYYWKYQIIFISIYLSFPVFCVVFPDFSSLFKIPWLENAFPFSQVFQSEWEPCLFLDPKKYVFHSCEPQDKNFPVFTLELQRPCLDLQVIFDLLTHLQPFQIWPREKCKIWLWCQFPHRTAKKIKMHP